MVVTMVTRHSFLLVVVSLLAQIVTCEIVPLSLILDPDSTVVHYVKGYISAPGYIDITNLKFLPADIPLFIHGDDDDDDFMPPMVFDDDKRGDDFVGNDDDFDEGDGGGGDDQPGAGDGGDGDDQPGDGEGGDDQPGAGEGGDDQPGDGDGGDEGNGEGNGDGDDGDTGDNGDAGNGGGEPGDGDDEGGEIPNDEGNNSTAVVPPSTSSNTTDSSNPAPGGGDRRMVRFLDGTDEDPPKPNSTIDIAMFRLPDTCANTLDGCDWADLGIGAHDDEVDGGVNYCCSKDAASRGICDESRIGRLIVSKGTFVGEERELFVPGDKDEPLVLAHRNHMEIKYDGSYVLILANCDDNGREILVLGSMEWMSSHGLLPGDLLGLLFYYVIVFLIYSMLFIGYGCGMRAYQDSAIPIQRYIIGTLGLGLIETFFLTVDLVVLNQSGSQSMFVVYAAIVFGVMKRSIFRCLGVMVSMGWGIVRDSLGMALAKIIFLGMLYCGLTAARDVFTLVAVEEVQSISTAAEDELIDIAVVLTIAITAINIIFYCWIIRSLSATTEYLRNMSQTSKLRRHLILRRVIWISLLYGVGWMAFSWYDTMFDVVSQTWDWIMEGSMHANYVFVLTSVAILWRPNPNAKDYAMQMELPAMGTDSDDDDFGNELELTPNVPSAADGNDPDHVNGMKVDRGYVS